jgi:hypothetical protein
MNSKEPLSDMLDKMIVGNEVECGIHETVLIDHKKDCVCASCKIMRTIKVHLSDLKKLKSNLEEISLEKLAELEHEQWVEWSKNIAETESISWKRINRWLELWIPYSKLTENQKEQDRIWAKKVLKILGFSMDKEKKCQEK